MHGGRVTLPHFREHGGGRMLREDSWDKGCRAQQIQHPYWGSKSPKLNKKLFREHVSIGVKAQPRSPGWSNGVEFYARCASPVEIFPYGCFDHLKGETGQNTFSNIVMCSAAGFILLLLALRVSSFLKCIHTLNEAVSQNLVEVED